jgi:hypothetical protein
MRAVLVVLATLCAGFTSSAWADAERGVLPTRLFVPDQDRMIVYQYYRAEFAAGRCPAGLIKTANGCFPVGEAPTLWVMGQPLPPAVTYQPVPPVLVQQLAPVPSGYGYVRIDNDVLLMDMSSRVVADVINDLSDYDGLGVD